MLFNSIQFFIFFPIVVGFYYSLPHRMRWMFLLAASCYFYMAFVPVYILILLVTIVIDYIAALLIEKSQGKTRKLYLIISIVATCLVLAIFKYFNFFNWNLAALAEFIGWQYPVKNLDILLPIGLSFHTFQSLSYVVEVYRGNQKAERHFGIYSLYVMFFPQLVAGPIERPQNLLHQFHEKHSFEYEQVIRGLLLIGWGLFKKVVVADRLALFVNPVYNNPADYSGPALIAATVYFAFQIYCDFSGYSDIAIGTAQVLGIKLMTNFERPYFARSVAEFWKRWHISLSTWFKDYLYFPLGGNRVAAPRWAMNIMIVFLVSGLWHGANWTYLIWGGLHGMYLVVGHFTLSLRKSVVTAIGLDRFPRLHGLLQTGITFVLVMVAWIFFRARTTDEAFYIVTHLFSGTGQYVLSFLSHGVQGAGKLQPFLLGQEKSEFVTLVCVMAVLIFIEILQTRGHVGIRDFVRRQNPVVRWGVYYAIVFVIMSFGVFEKTEFIYFQF